MFNGKHTPDSMINHKLFKDENHIKETVQVCKYHTKNFVPFYHCYLAPLRFLFTNTLKEGI